MKKIIDKQKVGFLIGIIIGIILGRILLTSLGVI